MPVISLKLSSLAASSTPPYVEMLMVSYLEIALWRCVVLMSLEWSEIWPLLCDLWVQEHENVTSIQKGQWDICSKEGIFLCPKLPLYRKLCDRKAHVYCGVKIRVSNLRFGVFLRIYKKRFSRQNVLQIFLSREIIYIYIFIHSFFYLFILFILGQLTAVSSLNIILYRVGD